MNNPSLNGFDRGLLRTAVHGNSRAPLRSAGLHTRCVADLQIDRASGFERGAGLERARLEPSVVAQASSPASCGGVSPPHASLHRDGARTRSRDGCATLVATSTLRAA